MKEKPFKISLKRKKRGQSAVEYFIVFAVVIAVAMLFINTTWTAAFFDHATHGAHDMVNMIKRIYRFR